MELASYAILGIAIIFVFVGIFLFYNNLKAKERQKKEQIKQQEEYELYQAIMEERRRQEEATTPIEFRLNTTKIRYDQYDCFKNWGVEELYKVIVLKNLWLQEPFHSSYSKLLLLLENNKLWIKVPDSKELILTNRDEDEKLSYGISLQAVFLEDLIEDIFYDIWIEYDNMPILTKQNLLMGVLVKLVELSKQIETIKIDKEVDETLLISWLYESMDKQDKKSFKKFYQHIVENNIARKIITKVLRNFCGEKYLHRLKSNPNETQKEPLILPELPKKRFLSLNE